MLKEMLENVREIEKEEMEYLFFNALQNKVVNVGMIESFLKMGEKKLKKGESISMKSIDSQGNGVLHFYCSNEKMQEEIILYLLQKKADPNLKNEQMKTPLHFAASNSSFHLPLFEKMLKWGFRKDQSDLNGNFPLHSYCHGNPHLDVALLSVFLDDFPSKKKSKLVFILSPLIPFS